MKIALLVDSLGFGGAQRQIANLAVELKEKGHDITFLRYVGDDFYLPLLQKAEIVPVTVDSKSRISRLRNIRKTVRSIEPDILISFMSTPNFCACVASMGKHSWKLIVSERIANHGAFLNKKAKLMKSVQAKYSDAIVCNSRCAEGLWEKYYPKTKNKLSTIYNIIDVPSITSVKRDDGKCRLLVAARYEAEKNLDGLIEAVKLLDENERERLEIHWYGKANVISGAESAYDKGLRLIQENSLGSSIFLHPATDKIHELMAESDFVALFSKMEGLPNAVIEGMTLKKPIVMSKVSDYEVLVDQTNGFLCDPASPEDIAKAIRDAVNTSGEERIEMGAASYKRIQAVCSREAVVSQWESLIHRLTDLK